MSGITPDEENYSGLVLPDLDFSSTSSPKPEIEFEKPKDEAFDALFEDDDFDEVTVVALPDFSPKKEEQIVETSDEDFSDFFEELEQSDTSSIEEPEIISGEDSLVDEESTSEVIDFDSLFDDITTIDDSDSTENSDDPEPRIQLQNDGLPSMEQFGNDFDEFFSALSDPAPESTPVPESGNDGSSETQNDINDLTEDDWDFGDDFEKTSSEPKNENSENSSASRNSEPDSWGDFNPDNFFDEQPPRETTEFEDETESEESSVITEEADDLEGTDEQNSEELEDIFEDYPVEPAQEKSKKAKKQKKKNKLVSFVEAILIILAKIPLIGKLFKLLIPLAGVLAVLLCLSPLVITPFVLYTIANNSVSTESNAEGPDNGGVIIDQFIYEDGVAKAVLTNTGDVIANVVVTFNVVTYAPNLNPSTWVSYQTVATCETEEISVEIDSSVPIEFKCVPERTGITTKIEASVDF